MVPLYVQNKVSSQFNIVFGFTFLIYLYLKINKQNNKLQINIFTMCIADFIIILNDLIILCERTSVYWRYIAGILFLWCHVISREL